jgi:hypothetical protein
MKLSESWTSRKHVAILKDQGSVLALIREF